MHIIIRILANSLAIFVASKVVHGFVFTGSWGELLVAGIILGIINSFVRPIVKLISLPLIFITFGLFSVVINIALILLATNFVPGWEIQGFWAAVWGIIVISLVNNFLSVLEKK